MKDKFFSRTTSGNMPWKVIVNGVVRASFYDESDAQKFIEKYGLVTVAIKEVKAVTE